MPTGKKAVRAGAKAKASARVKGARSVAKVSPLKGMPIADWVRLHTAGWQQGVVVAMLEIAVRAAPKATVSIKWGQPVFEQNGPFAFVKPAQDHVTFGFWRGDDLKDPGGVLQGDGVRMRHLKVTSPEGLDRKGLAALFREAAALNLSEGRPGKK